MTIRIQKEYPLGTWSAEPMDYNLDSPIGYGMTISEAIDSFIEAWELRFGQTITEFVWIGKAGMWN